MNIKKYQQLNTDITISPQPYYSANVHKTILISHNTLPNTTPIGSSKTTKRLVIPAYEIQWELLSKHVRPVYFKPLLQTLQHSQIAYKFYVHYVFCLHSRTHQQFQRSNVCKIVWITCSSNRVLGELCKIFSLQTLQGFRMLVPAI